MGRLVVGCGVAALGGDVLGAPLLLDAAHLGRIQARHARAMGETHARYRPPPCGLVRARP